MNFADWSALDKAEKAFVDSQSPEWHWNARELARKRLVELLLASARPLIDGVRPKCEKCNGSGSYYAVADGYVIPESVTCFDCNGTGWEE